LTRLHGSNVQLALLMEIRWSVIYLLPIKLTKITKN
jgi:hypothetical protein